MRTAVLFWALILASPSSGQTTQPDSAASPKHQKAKKPATKKPAKGTAADLGSGAGSVAGGAAKGAGAAASGAGKGAVDLVTLHPIDAGAAVGTGAVRAGKDVTVGSVKGVGKVGKGIGHALKKIF